MSEAFGFYSVLIPDISIGKRAAMERGRRLLSKFKSGTLYLEAEYTMQGWIVREVIP